MLWQISLLILKHFSWSLISDCWEFRTHIHCSPYFSFLFQLFWVPPLPWLSSYGRPGAYGPRDPWNKAFLLHPGHPEQPVNYGLAKKCIWVFLYHLMEKPEQNSWPTWYIPVLLLFHFFAPLYLRTSQKRSPKPPTPFISSACHLSALHSL